MKQFKTLGLAVMMALVLAACFGATSASATTVCVGGATTAPCPAGSHPGGTVILSSTNSSLLVHGASTISCTHSTIHGTAPSTTATTVQIPVTLTYSSCTAFGIAGASVNVGPACQDKITLTVMTGSAQFVTIPSGCTIDVSVPAINCTVTIPGEQTIGENNGIAWTNGTATAFSHATLTNALVTDIVVDPGGGFGCPTAGTHTGTLNGTYKVTSPGTAPGVTLN
jgi:hypothetical protein